ncbi:hypothetical protein PMIN05_007796 [Paraphaeosphaeria minitans]
MGRLARFSTQHSLSASTGRARGDQTVAGRVGQTAARDPGWHVRCGGCCKLLLSGGRGGPLSPRRQPLRRVRERRLACNGNADDERKRFRREDAQAPSNALAKRSVLLHPGLPIYTAPAIEPVAVCGGGVAPGALLAVKDRP